MIRRHAQLADGAAGWVLISQIEHARISAQLAAQCTGRFSAGSIDSAVRREVLAAIEHHDDGWADWERTPRLHLNSGKPVSFMELEVQEAIDIWTMSAAAAEANGPLAAWMVAGHFARLLKNSEHAHTSKLARIWHDGVQIARREALSQWQRANSSRHTSGLAEEALQWLWTFDELSLWFCTACPAAGQPHADAQPAKPAGAGTPIEMHLSAGPPGAAGASPWRFDVAAIEIEAAARIVPAQPYDSPEALLAAARPHTLRWHLATPGGTP